MVAGSLWEVVGGADKGGIVVREGQDTSSALKQTRLSTGASIRELQLEGERLRYERLTGSGPDTGWVSVRIPDKELVVKVAATADKTLQGSAPTLGRKLRVLALHGKCSNSNVMKVQCAGLKKELGKDVDWVFLDGNIPYDKDNEGGTHYDPTDYEKMISKDKPWLQWYNHRLQDSAYERVEEGMNHIRNCLAEQGPFDVIVSFSMGSNMVSMLLDALRREGVEPPWKLSVFFNGGPPRDSKYEVTKPFQHPLVKIHGGTTDPFWAGGEPSMNFMFTDLVELAHEDGHSFPRTQPRAGEIFVRVAAEMRARAGFPAKGE